MKSYNKTNYIVIPGLTRNPSNKYQIGINRMDSCLRRNDIKQGKLIVTIISFILLLVSIISHPPSTHAAGYGLSIYPPLLRVNIKPGKSITQVFKIDNLTSDDKFFVARLIPFGDADLLGNPVIDLKSTAPWLTYFSLANSDIKFGDPFLIKGNSSEQLIINLTLPENAPVKDLYATLLVSTYYNISGVGYQGSLVSATTGTNLLITIASDAFPPTILRVENFLIKSGSLFKIGNYYITDSLTPLTFSSSALNAGNFTAETKGIFKISDRRDQPIYLDGILPVYVISKTKRLLTNTDGKEFTFTPHLGRFGLYRASISIKTENANAENTISFIVLPFKAGIGLLLTMLFLTVIFRTASSSKEILDSPKI